MNPWHLDPSQLMIWGLVAHLIADWPLQNEWMALNKMKRNKTVDYVDDEGMDTRTKQQRDPSWWNRHPSAYVHVVIHAFFLCFVFGWVAVPLAYIHLIIDCRWPVEKWSKFIGQTQPTGVTTDLWTRIGRKGSSVRPIPVVDIGLEVRFWNDQVFHIICIAIAALIVGSV
jgi:hypothetical protein